MSHYRKTKQSGQTMIETIVAIFIMVTALSAGTGLAIYALSSSDTAKNQTIAGNLAREGIEAVRIIRDSNWLAQTASFSNDCGADYGGKPCYPNAFLGTGAGDGMSPSANGNDYRAYFSVPTRSWRLDTVNGQENYLLCLQPAGSTYPGMYLHNDNGMSGTNGTVICNNPNFARRIVITSVSPTEVQVESIVVWSGKRCPTVLPTVPTSAPGQCKLVLQDRLTNWKDYK